MAYYDNPQIRLNDKRPIEAEIMEFLKDQGSHGGWGKRLLIAGYKSLKEGNLEVIETASAVADPIEKEESEKAKKRKFNPTSF